MKVRFIHHYFHPDRSSVSQIISKIAFHLAAGGDDVSVIASRNRYDLCQEDRLSGREMVRGVDVTRVSGPSLGKGAFWRRLVDMFSFVALAAVRAFAAPRTDVVVILTNPPFFALLGLLLKRIRRERFVHVVMDVYPEVAFRAGVLRERGIAGRFLSALSRTIIAGADAVVVLGEDMKEVVVRGGARPDRVTVIRNFVDVDRIVPVSPEHNPLRELWGIGGKFVVAYSGNFGVSHSFDEMLAVAEALSDDDTVRFLVIGGGERRKAFEAGAAARKLGNVRFLPYQDDERLAQSLSVGDVHYVSLRPEFRGLVVPSKVYGIMAVGRPVIFQGPMDSEVGRMVVAEGIGIVVPPGDAYALRGAILKLRDDEADRRRMGERARLVAERDYSGAVSLQLYRDVFSGKS